jgi:hypothetical protein
MRNNGKRKGVQKMRKEKQKINAPKLGIMDASPDIHSQPERVRGWVLERKSLAQPAKEPNRYSHLANTA